MYWVCVCEYVCVCVCACVFVCEPVHEILPYLSANFLEWLISSNALIPMHEWFLYYSKIILITRQDNIELDNIHFLSVFKGMDDSVVTQCCELDDESESKSVQELNEMFSDVGSKLID